MKKQNPSIKERISALETEVRNLKERFENFVENDFQHVRNRLDWIFWIFLLGTAISIVIALIFK